ncbi:dCTP deaminase domain-containing protein [Sphingobacterium kitahiroshimense]|uniref:dCTP deaminase domain-containing protein n=1 Tax=Sphingobacterium kitahiroshimense TaxID=470446 RepID=UPI00320B83E0
MAFLGGQDLARLLIYGNVIQNEKKECNYRPSHIKQAAYELCLGNEVYLTDDKNKTKVRLNDENNVITINPGQFALLLTDEVVNVPNNLLGFISIKASEKLKGLINVSGFHVDPGFKGKLLFSVYNASPSSIQLTKGKPYFLIWFSELKNTLSNDYLYNSKNHQDQNSIDSKYITPLINGEMVSPHELAKRMHASNNKIDTIETTHALKNEKIFWAITTGITLLITLNIAFWLNKYDYQKGYIDGKKESFNEVTEKRIKKLEENSIPLEKELPKK